MTCLAEPVWTNLQISEQNRLQQCT